MSKATPRPGRPPLTPGQEAVFVSLRMTPEQKAKLARIGGAPWVRKQIDKAAEPKKADHEQS